MMEKKLKRMIVICNDSAYFMRHRRSVVSKMATLGHDVTVVTGGDSIPLSASVGWKYVNMRIDRFSFSLLADFTFAFRTFYMIVARRPDCLHLITLKPAVVAGPTAVLTRLFLGKPGRMVITIPGLGRLMGQGAVNGARKHRISRAIVSSVIRFLSSRSNLYFTFETANDRDHWIEEGFVRNANSFVINGAGVDGSLFFPAADHPRPPGKKLRVLFASRLLRAKGLDLFIGCARALRGRNLEFVVAGMTDRGDPDSYSLEELQQESSITFIGESYDMPALLRSVDIVCLPTSYGEGIPRILIEAAASGVASVATDLPGCREIVKDSINGVIVPLGNPAEMTMAINDAILRYQSDPSLLRRHSANAASVFGAGGFSEKMIVDKFVQVLLEDEVDLS